LRGEPRAGLRLNVVETLRAAAPWQRLRREEIARFGGESTRIEIRQDDFRITRFKHRSETTTIFVVDASGSSALHRLAEAKGAVELLLADCYVRRDRVALVAFRGQFAEVLLPPTRSLVRAKRSLASLPGGGGTPLASGIDLGMMLADSVKRRGGTPILILMTDGRANVARDGTGMAAALGSLLTAEDIRPDIVVGHSAGAAVLARACLDGILQPGLLVSVNGALLPLRGLAGQLFAPAARFLARVPVVPQLFARRAVDRRLVVRLLADTGSHVPAASVECYQRLMCTPTHVAAALQMMANWDLDPLSRALAGLTCPLHLVACGNDRTVPPSDAEQLARRLPQGHLVRIPGLGHLGHEEDPQRFADLFTALAGPA
jgi:putative magnesium chelatase accessory protein